MGCSVEAADGAAAGPDWGQDKLLDWTELSQSESEPELDSESESELDTDPEPKPGVFGLGLGQWDRDRSRAEEGWFGPDDVKRVGTPCDLRCLLGVLGLGLRPAVCRRSRAATQAGLPRTRAGSPVSGVAASRVDWDRLRAGAVETALAVVLKPVSIYIV